MGCEKKIIKEANLELDFPICVDFEASSLSKESYPIEIAWNMPDGSIETHLINPESVPTWNDWDKESEQVHGIAREVLTEEGEDPSWVRERICETVKSEVLLSDAPDFDVFWMNRLFDAAGRSNPFTFADFNELILRILFKRYKKHEETFQAYETLSLQARSMAQGQHRANYDVKYLLHLWLLANRGSDR